jgi:hypothetical protein
MLDLYNSYPNKLNIVKTERQPKTSLTLYMKYTPLSLIRAARRPLVHINRSKNSKISTTPFLFCGRVWPTTTQFASLSVANEGNNSNSSQTTLPFPLWIALLSSMPLFTILRIRTASILLYTHAKTTLYLPTHSPLFARPQKLASTL